MGNGYSQNHSARQGFGFRTRLAGFLEMPEREYAEMIREIEADPLFVKLRYAQDEPERAIRTRCLRQTDLSRRFFELKEEIAGYSGDGGAEVEKLLADKEKLVRLIRRLGEENFKRYFICSEDELSLAEIADNCGLTPAEAREILALVNAVDVHSEFFMPSTTLPENNLAYNKIAVLATTSGKITMQFTSAHWARGLYEVDYEKIERMAAAGRVSKDEKRRIGKLLEKIEFVNVRKSLMYTVIARLIEKQRDYLHSGGQAGLAPFMQLELAKEMRVNPSIISRATAGRSVETPWGEEKPLKELFFSARPGQKRAVMRHIEEVLKDEKIELERREIRKPYSDKAIGALLSEKYGISIAPRTVAKYRNLMKLPGAFHRK